MTGLFYGVLRLHPEKRKRRELLCRFHPESRRADEPAQSGPIEIHEEAPDRSAATKRELEIKRHKRKAFIEELVRTSRMECGKVASSSLVVPAIYTKGLHIACNPLFFVLLREFYLNSQAYPLYGLKFLQRSPGVSEIFYHMGLTDQVK